MSMIDISDLSKAQVLAALYNASRPFGMGMLHFEPGDMTTEQAQSIFDSRGDDITAMFGRKANPNTYRFEYLKGRLMKVDLSGDCFDSQWYDRDIGDGAAARAVEQIRLETISQEVH